MPQHARGVAKQSARPHQRAPPWSTKAQRRNTAKHEAGPGALTESVAGMAEIGLEVRGKLWGSDITYDGEHEHHNTRGCEERTMPHGTRRS